MLKVLQNSVVCSFLVATLWASAGCESKPETNTDPRDVFESFLLHWFRGEAELAFDYVYPADREALTAPLAGTEGLDDEHRPKAWEMLVVADIENVYDIAKIEVVVKADGQTGEIDDNGRADGQRAVLTLHHQDGSTSRADLIFEAGRWYVDLPLEASGKAG